MTFTWTSVFDFVTCIQQFTRIPVTAVKYNLDSWYKMLASNSYTLSH